METGVKANSAVVPERSASVGSAFKELSFSRKRILFLCALVAALDGMDTQSVGLLAPSIANAVGLPLANMGGVFSAGLFGMMIGALSIGPIADSLGDRRRPIIASTFLFGALTL